MPDNIKAGTIVRFDERDDVLRRRILRYFRTGLPIVRKPQPEYYPVGELLESPNLCDLNIGVGDLLQCDSYRDTQTLVVGERDGKMVCFRATDEYNISIPIEVTRVMGDDVMAVYADALQYACWDYIVLPPTDKMVVKLLGERADPAYVYAVTQDSLRVYSLQKKRSLDISLNLSVYPTVDNVTTPDFETPTRVREYIDTYFTHEKDSVITVRGETQDLLKKVKKLAMANYFDNDNFSTGGCGNDSAHFYWKGTLMGPAQHFDDVCSALEALGAGRDTNQGNDYFYPIGKPKKLARIRF